MSNIAFTVSGFNVGISEIMLVLLALFVVFLIGRNIALYQMKSRPK